MPTRRRPNRGVALADIVPPTVGNYANIGGSGSRRSAMVAIIPKGVKYLSEVVT
jgi:hypothetical protein